MNYQPPNMNIQNSLNSMSQSMNNVRESFNKTISDVSAQDITEAGKDFINSNSLVAKFVFLIMILILFMVLLNLGIYLILYFTKPDKQPYLIKGLIAGSSRKFIPQDPKTGTAVRIYRSNNENKGLELTWSVWLKRNSLPSEGGSEGGSKEYEHIFSKGKFQPEANGITTLGNAPGVYFNGNDPNVNKILIRMDTVVNDTLTNHFEEIEIDNIPLRRWFHLAIRIENKIMDIYINGVVTKRVVFTKLPKQNYESVYINHNGGFDGGLSDLRYFDSGLNVFQILNIVNAGPDLRSADGDTNKNYDYLSNSWYM